MPNSNFDVMDLVDAEDEFDTSGFFKQHPVSGNIKNGTAGLVEPEATPEPPKREIKKPSAVKKPWTPDSSLTSDMPELHQSAGAVYKKDEVILQADTTMKNAADEELIQDATDTMNDLDIKLRNIVEAKRRHGITKLQIPPGEIQLKFLIAASDRDHKRAQAQLDELFEILENTYPQMILERISDIPDNTTTTETPEITVSMEDEFPSLEEVESGNETTPSYVKPLEVSDVKFPSLNEVPLRQESVLSPIDTTKITITKDALSDVAWSEEEAQKIKRSRTIELNIVESNDIEFSSITEADSNVLDSILEQYERKSNDQNAPLPASKYRATFTGLTYAEVVDLSTSGELNSLDAERKKWSICFNHIKNQSIGPWETYMTYIDPSTKKRVKANIGSPLPRGVHDTDVHIVSKFEDFLRKTSYLDLEFILWKILCATTMDRETISIDCHHVENGVTCNHNYDWIYSPEDLLVKDEMSPALLEEMKQAAEAETKEQIMKVYNSSMVSGGYVVKLHTSGFSVVYGHASAYEYLEGIYSKLKEIRDEMSNTDESKTDPTIISRSMVYTALSVVKAILIPMPDGSFTRVTGVNNIIRILNTLDEIDWETLMEIQKMVTEPYAIRFELKDIVCPKCKSRSSITIDNISRLLFILARSLSSVNVTLKSK